MPFYIAAFGSVCYLVAYGFTTYTAKFDNQLHFLDIQNHSWANAGLSSTFTRSLTIWTVLCIIRNILVIIAWIVFCLQSNWNIGSAFVIKIEELTQKVQNIVKQEDRDYTHLFFGNPYLPYGVYTIHDKTKKKT